jgi:ribosomal protein L40E
MDEALAPHREKAEQIAREHLHKSGLVDEPSRGEPPPPEATVETAEPDESAKPERRICSKCDASNEPDAKFCKECATSLVEKSDVEKSDEA